VLAFLSTQLSAAELEIRLGQTLQSGAANSDGHIIARVEAAYFQMINERGGVKGRPIRLMTLDDSGTSEKALDLTRRLVEEDGVVAIFGSLGDDRNSAIQEYLNANSVPQLFVAGRLSRFSDPLKYPWTMPFDPNYQTEGALYGQYLLTREKAPTIGIVRSADEWSAELSAGLRSSLGAHAVTMILGESILTGAGPSVDDSVRTLRAIRPDVITLLVPPTAARDWIGRANALGWRPTVFLPSGALPTGWTDQRKTGDPLFEGALSIRFLMDPRDPTWSGYSQKRFHFQEFTPWEHQPGAQAYIREFADKYIPEIDANDPAAIYAYTVADLMVRLLEQCRNRIDREDLMAQAANLNGISLPLLIPAIRLNTNADRYTPITQGQLIRFDGNSWIGVGNVMQSDAARWPTRILQHHDESP
jgi:branched-chain amino acid transport system substrate-binding protein